MLLQGSFGDSLPITLAAAAFKALHSMVLREMSVTRADLSGLTACKKLSSLQLDSCEVQQAEASSTTSPLSALNSLRQLSLQFTDCSLAAGMTQLTRLSLAGEEETAVADCLGHIIGLNQLQELELSNTVENDITAEEVADILTSCKQLTSLALHYALGQREFDLLLKYAPQLTSFTCHDLYLEEDRSAYPCSWKELTVLAYNLSAEMLAYLPTASLTQLEFGGGVVFPSPSPTLEFSAGRMFHIEHMPVMVRRSLTNLMRSPAWQQCGPKVHVSFEGSLLDDLPKLDSLLAALAPLANKEVALSIWLPKALVGASAVQQLGVTLGSSLKQLVLSWCDLSQDFWPAVWAHLPGLQQLTISHGAINARELEDFCSSATRPLQVNLGHKLYREVGAEGKFEGQCRVCCVPGSEPEDI
jgi:hypothetical protein